MNSEGLLKNNKFRFLIAALLVVAPFEVLSFFSIHLHLWIELPLFFAVIIAFGRRVFIRGIRSLFKLDFSDINLLMGIDVAIENADIALMNDNLNMIPYLVGLGKKCVEKIRFNIVSAVSVKFLFLSLAIAGLSNLALAIFADVGVTLLVILNSLRLYGYKGTLEDV